MKPRIPSCLILAALAMAALSPSARGLLTPDQIILIVNSRVPESRKLAEFYASQRHIPDGRILELDLPFPQEDLAPAIYDEQVVPKVREFLLDNKLKSRVTCLVTFWGVPIRIQHRQNTPNENQEIGQLDREIRKSEGEIAAAIKPLEAAAASVDASFKAGEGETVEQMAARAERAIQSLRTNLPKVTDLEKRNEGYDTLIGSIRTLAGRGAAMQEQSRPELQVVRPQSATRVQIARLQMELQAAQRTINSLQSSLSERANRDKLLATVTANYGAVQYVQALRNVRSSLDNTESTAAFDSELSLLWFDNYPKQRWFPNFLHHGVSIRGAGLQQLMVMRIDGPNEAVARRIIADSILAETEGLTGVVALDSRGNHSGDPYGQFDQLIRDLGELLKSKTKLQVVQDDRDAVFAPGSVKDVAVYCGWYALRNYTRGFEFHRGAVAYHIASLEMVSLRNPGEKGWVPNLLRDGAVASLGPVDEPYLHAFPKPTEFVPLLLTGKLTLAEVYWKTTPLSSWMTACIGDPLYRPYAKNPPLKVADLPPDLQRIFGVIVPGSGDDAKPPSFPLPAAGPVR